MSSASWLTSPECSTSLIHSGSGAVQWLEFLFLSSCPQRILFSAIDALFLLTLVVFLVQKLYSRFILPNNTNSSINKPLVEKTPTSFRVTYWFHLSVSLTAVLAISYLVLCIVAFCQGIRSPWQPTEALFRLSQAVTHIAIVVLIAHELKFKAVAHSMSLRVYWVANFVVVCLFSVSAIIRFITTGSDFDVVMKVDDIVLLVVLPISLFLLVVALRGSSGIVNGAVELGTSSRLSLSQTNGHTHRDDLNLSGYATASWISRLTWFWLNPLLKKGYKSPLKIDEVPSLSPAHKAEKMAYVFQTNWPKQEENSKNPVRTTLMRTFWKDFLLTGFLAIVKLLVMYVGPVLIDDFVDFTAGKRTSDYEGYYLVSTLFVAKIIECLSSHHFNFHSQKLGMLIRSTIITSLYKKGLKLSCSSRQAHGVGQIVNYMAVDAQMLSDLMVQLHSIWLMPLQLGASLVLLYTHLGISAFAALAVVIGTLIFSVMQSRKNNIFQYFVMMNRDSRLKATNEMLNNMRVIKFQAWEEHFNQRIQSFRDKELGWLRRFSYSLSFMMSVLGSMPIVLAVLVFGIAIPLGITLDAGTVFTVTTVLKLVQEPVRTFPQSLTSVTQAMVSLGRLDGFLVSEELDERALEREEQFDGGIVLEVKDGTFSWDDEGVEMALKNVNIEIKKGELAAIVGTVGSGKSSLLASILGELHKKSGKECVRGALKDKTILLVTHQVDFLHNASLILTNPASATAGKYRELLESGLDFGALVAAYETSMDLVEMSTSISGENVQTPKSPNLPLSRAESTNESRSLERSKSEKGTSKLVEDEERERGSVSADVYRQYCTEAYGWWGVIAVFVISFFWQLFYVGGDYWLSYETSDSTMFKASLFMMGYSILGGLACLMTIIRAYLAAYMGLKTSQKFFCQILHSMLHAPMSFFDTTPSGRILSRASTDQAAIDFIIPFLLSMLIVLYISTFTIVVVTCVNAWPTAFLVIPLLWVNIWYQGYYIATSRELTRLDSITKAPVIHHFSETISGVMTIRSFRKQNEFYQESIGRVNTNLRMDFHNNSSNEWFGLRLELMGAFLLCCSALFLVMLPSNVINPGTVGLTLSYGLSLNSVMYFTIYVTCIIENRMVSVERIKQFIRVPSEAPWRIAGCLPYPNWPSNGDIQIRDLKVRYRDNTPLVLKGVSLDVRGGEKIGVVGRTGSGKSTLIQVFFRLIEPCGGRIVIDGVDICKLGLYDLRSRFGIIPQDPVLFEGTIRSNIDPLGLHSDEQIWKSLERCQLKQWRSQDSIVGGAQLGQWRSKYSYT